MGMGRVLEHLTAVGISYLLPGSSHLKIDERGLEMRISYWTRFYPWHECSEFVSVPRPRSAFRRFAGRDIEATFLHSRPGAKPRMVGVPALWDLGLTDLGLLLNHYRQAALESAP
jgi:hypothetical protein